MMVLGDLFRRGLARGRSSGGVFVWFGLGPVAGSHRDGPHIVP
jgi:hypothetical protein